MDVMARPRVMMVVRLFHPWVGGTERQAHKLARQLIEMGHDVTVVTGRWFFGTPRQETIEGVPVRRHSTLWEFFGLKGLRKFGGYLYMLTLAWHMYRTRDEYDVVHVHGLNYHTAVAATVGRWLGKPTLVKLANSGMASDIARTRAGRQLAGSRFLLPAALSCDRFVALSPAIAAELMEAGVARDPIVSIPNGVEVGGDVPPRVSVPDCTRVVFVGRLHPQKGADVLLEAARLLVDAGEGEWRIRLVGEGPARSDLEVLAARLKLNSVVEFVGEVGSPVSELDRADIFVLPSRTEGMSNALLEAMARGTAAVATAVAGSASVIEDGRTGLLVPPEDPTALADAMQRLAEDGELRERLANAARQEIENRYAMSEVADRYADLYRELIEERSGSRLERSRR